MELITGNQRVARVYTIRRAPGADGRRFSRNRHHFLLESGAMVGAMGGTFNAISIAQRHMMMPDTELFSQVAIVLQHPTEQLEELAAFCHYGRGVGGRKEVAGKSSVPFPVVLVVRKYCAYGGVTRLFMEGCVTESDLVREGNGRVHLTNDFDPVGIVSSYFNFYMGEAGQPYIAPHKVTGIEHPSSFRYVTRFGGFTAERLTSIPDAQRRKTFFALPYIGYANSAIESMQEAGEYLHSLAFDHGPDYGAEERAIALSRIGNFQGALVSVSQYYEDGIKPGYAYCWRPMAGLNPDTMYAQMILAKIAEVLGEFGTAFTQLPEDEEGRILAADLEGVLPLWYRVCGLYMVYLDNERFTGTPKPIPAGLSQCRAGT